MSLKPEAAPRAGDAMWWRWLAASVAPNPRVLLLVTVGWVTELVLLGCVSDNIYYVSRPARWLAVMFAAWFWVTMGWVVWLVASRLRHPLARNLESTICGRLRAVRAELGCLSAHESVSGLGSAAFHSQQFPVALDVRATG